MADLLTLDGMDDDTARMLAEVMGHTPVIDTPDIEIKKRPVFDLHCDTIDRLALSSEPVVSAALGLPQSANPQRMESLRDNDAHLSLERMNRFAWAQCFAIFVPDQLQGDDAWEFFCRMKKFFTAQTYAHSDLISPAFTSCDIDNALAAGKTAGILTVEGASFLEDDASAEEHLDALLEAGVRILTITWNGQNALGSGHTTHNGLTAFGRACVRELEARGIVVDVSHLNDEGFRDVLDVAQKPFIASHSNARAVCAHQRNLEDWQLREIADCGGIVGLNFYTKFLSEIHGNPSPEDIVKQVDHLLEVAGENAVALGSDYDGADVPVWLNSADKIDTLYDLLSGEFGVSIANKVFFENAHTFFLRAEN